MRYPSLRATGAALIVVLAASACASSDAGDDAPASDEVAAETVETDDAERTRYPLTVENCGVEVVFDAPPERIVLLNSAPTAALDAIGVLDRGVGRAGVFPDAYFAPDTRERIAGIPSLGGEDIDASGHFQISQEVLLAAEPDLVLGLPDGISRESLADNGIPVLVEPAMCPEGLDAPTFDDIHAQVETYGEVFDEQAAARAVVDDLRARVEALTAAVEDGDDRTAAVLFPTIGGGAGYAYGNRSMAHPQLETAGFVNVFADVDERVFEVTLEELLERDPDVLVLLHIDGDADAVEAEIRGLPGADGLTAVADDAILVQLFNFTEPPTPLSIDGLERIVTTFGGER